MSGSLGRFVSLAIPEAAEAVGNALVRPQPPVPGAQPAGNSQQSPSRRSRTPRVPTQAQPRQIPPPTLGKQEARVTTATIDHEQQLANLLDAAPSSEKRAELLIKIGGYAQELRKYAPMLRQADAETAREALSNWIADGDGELKKMVINAQSGSEDFPLLSMTTAEGPEFELKKMLEAEPNDRAKAEFLTKMTLYRGELANMLSRSEMLKMDPAAIDQQMTDWLNRQEDGRHQPLKKALVDAARMARAQAQRGVGENDAVDEKAGNAATHAGSQLSNENDRTYVPRSTGEGSGPRLRGSEAGQAPGQADGAEGDVESGPNDTGEGGVRPNKRIRRKGTTGGLGSVAGQRADRAGVSDTRAGQNDDGADLDKSADLGIELLKFMPDEALEALQKLAPEDQVAACDIFAQDAADLMAWQQQTGDQLQKSAMDQAVAEWLTADPNTVAMKKWVAEALATAEEIPLGLAKTIMAYEAPGPVRVRRRAA